MIRILLIVIAIILSIKVSTAQVKPIGTIGFYNIENLFDTTDDPSTNDEEYLPEGKNKWSIERYQNKIENMSKVISEMANGVDILGVCEVENQQVIEDLIHSPNLKAKKYQLVHFDSPDGRGIDVALIYKKDRFTPIAINKIPVYDTEEPDFKTRDILWVKGLYHGDTLHLAVNHWPSRRGGKEDKRIIAAQFLRHAVDSVTNINPNAKIILMGDFNDDPSNKSIIDILNADNNIDQNNKEMLFNVSSNTFKNGFGTLFYKGSWNLFDQIMISQSLMENNASKYFYIDNSFKVFSAEYMSEQNGNNKGAPLRTFSYGVYKNGYSDHYPTFIVLGEK